MDNKLQKALLDVKCKVALCVNGSSLSSFKCGGKIDAVVTPHSEKEFVECVRILNEAGAKYKVIGNCTNILISDEGYSGVVVRTAQLNKIRAEDNIAYAETGVKLEHMVRWCANKSLSGLEWAAGIPGCVGGACYQNAGCFNHDIGGVVSKIRFLDNCKIVEYGTEDLHFNYRHSVMQEKPLICLGAYFDLEMGGYFDIAKRIDEYRQKRQTSQPRAASLGSVFRRMNGESAAFYIDRLGLKGCAVGGAYIATEHAGFICNNGFATSGDFLNLARFAQKEVYEKKGIFFPLEIEYLGEQEEILNRLYGLEN